MASAGVPCTLLRTRLLLRCRLVVPKGPAPAGHGERAGDAAARDGAAGGPRDHREGPRRHHRPRRVRVAGAALGRGVQLRAGAPRRGAPRVRVGLLAAPRTFCGTAHVWVAWLL